MEDSRTDDRAAARKKKNFFINDLKLAIANLDMTTHLLSSGQPSSLDLTHRWTSSRHVIVQIGLWHVMVQIGLWHVMVHQLVGPTATAAESPIHTLLLKFISRRSEKAQSLCRYFMFGQHWSFHNISWIPFIVNVLARLLSFLRPWLKIFIFPPSLPNNNMDGSFEQMFLKSRGRILKTNLRKST